MGEEQEEFTGYLGVVLERREAAGGVLSTGGVHGGETGRRRGRAARQAARLGGVGTLGSPAQGRVRAARGEQQLAGGGMAREQARKLAERDGTRRA